MCAAIRKRTMMMHETPLHTSLSASTTMASACWAPVFIWTCTLLYAISVTEIEAAFFSGAQRKTAPKRWSEHCQSILGHQLDGTLWGQSTALNRLYTSSNDGVDEQVAFSSSVSFAMDPESDDAREVTERLGLSEEQHTQLSQLASLVVEWNERINLVSRRDCNVENVFGRHVLPSIALAANTDWNGLKVIDVGTGGGFPGLPLAIIYPEAEFMLVDSVGKKLKAVEEMARELELTNVRIHHGRAEEMTDDILEGSRDHLGAYDVCLGRSVAALPKFCFWISELIKPESGRLVYIIGGDIEDGLLAQVESDVAIDNVLDQDGASDKRILTFNQEAVALIAAASGEVKRKRGKPKAKVVRANKQKAKGQWKKGRDEPKQRGFDDFQRY